MKRRRKGTGSVFAVGKSWRAEYGGRRVRARSRAEAEALLAAMLPGGLLTSTTTVSDYAETFVARLNNRVRAGTVRYYGSILVNQVIPDLGARRLTEVTKADVKDALTRYAARMKPKSVLNVRQVMHALFAEAIEDGLVAANPAKLNGRILGVKVQRGAPKAMTAEQLGDFLEAAAEHAPEWLVAWRFMALTGVRPGEMLALRWNDILWSSRRARIVRSVTDGVILPTKSGRSREVDVATALLEALREWKGENRKAPYVWPSEFGTPVHATYMRQRFATTAAAAGLPDHFTPHCLRHTYATLQLIRGVSIYYVQRQLGHASIQQTVDHYGSWLPSNDARHADDLERQLMVRLSGSEDALATPLPTAKAAK